MITRFLRYGLIIALCGWAASVIYAAKPADSKPASDSSQVVAYVNDHPIPIQAVERELIRIHTMGAIKDSVSRARFSVENLVQRLINNELLAEEARDIGMDQDSIMLETMARFRDSYAFGEMMAELFPDTFKASEEELRKEYDFMFQRFKLRMMCIVDSTAAMQVADSIRRGADMASFAKDHSVDRYKDLGGDAGYWYLASAPPLMQSRLLKAPQNQLLEPMHLWRSWVLVRIEGKAEADTVVKLDSVRTNLEQRIISSKRQAALAAYVDSLRNRFPIVQDTLVLDSILNRMGRGEAAQPIIVAKVGGKRVLTEADLRESYLRRSMSSKDTEAGTLIRQTLKEETQNMLLQEAASFPRFVESPAVVQALRMIEDSMLVTAYLQDVLAATIAITPEEIQAYYDQNKERFREAGNYKVSTLTRIQPQEADSDYQMLVSGTDFAWLAQRNSIDEAAKRGGDRGWLQPAKFPLAVRAALDTVALGTILPPNLTDNGFVIYRLEGKEPGAQMSLERVRKSIEGRLLQQKQLNAIDETVKKLRSSAHITIQQSVIKSLQISGRTEPAPDGHMPMSQ
jgi:parvulin-like peptidyl-prolyl isomerase